MAMVVVTLAWLRNEYPRFPWMTLLNQVKYCCKRAC